MITSMETRLTKKAKGKTKLAEDLGLGRDKAGVIISTRGKDLGPTDAQGRPFADRHGEFIVEGDDRGQPHLRRVDPSPLDRYCSRKQLADDEGENDRLWRAGDRLRTDFLASGIPQRITADLGAVGGCGGHPDMAPRQVAAWQSLKRAMAAVGPTLSPVLQHVCCYEGSAADWAVRRRWHHSHGLASLKLGLEALARHYGLR